MEIDSLGVSGGKAWDSNLPYSGLFMQQR